MFADDVSLCLSSKASETCTMGKVALVFPSAASDHASCDLFQLCIKLLCLSEDQSKIDLPNVQLCIPCYFDVHKEYTNFPSLFKSHVLGRFDGLLHHNLMY